MAFIIKYLRRIILFISVAIKVNMAYASDPCLLIPLGINDKAVQSELIVEGKVVSSTSYWNKLQNNIYTLNRIKVYKIFKGTGNPTEVVIITEGGRVDLTIQKFTSTLELSPGDEGVFFCSRSSLLSFQLPAVTNDPVYTVYSSMQGFIQYNVNDLTASVPFRFYMNIADSLYSEITTETGINYRIISTNPTFIQQHHVPKTGVNTINAVPTITNFTPTSITAGTRSLLTINGTNFGATQGTGFVEFKNANDNGATTVQPKANDYRAWSNIQIQVWVPSSSLTGPSAGTGTIRVTNSDPNSVTSAGTLTITYSVINVEYNNTGQYVEHKNSNTSGGYTFQFESSTFATNAPAIASFKRALYSWICNTHINFVIGANTSTNVAANDGVNVIRFDIGSELPASVLARTSSSFSGCINGGVDTVWTITDIDLTYDGGAAGFSWQYGPANPSGSQIDFETVTVHELGHAHALSHIILPGAVMHYSIAPGQTTRTLNATNDIAGGNFVMARSTVAHGVVCKPSPMISLTPAAAVSIAANPGTTICSGTSVTFTATPVHGGDTPSYQWKKGGTNVGTNSATYTDNALANGNVITCQMTSSVTCATGNPATSNSLTMIVNPSVTASVSIAASPGVIICSGTNVTFTASPVNGGAPTYQWKKNGTNVGTNSVQYSNNTLVTSDQITCQMTSSASCVSGSPATSNTLTMTVNPSATASVSITASPGITICSGTSVTFTASPVNGGSPTYQWKKNGTNVGTNTFQYTSSSLINSDQITCQMTSSVSCVTGNPVTSNILTMTVTLNVTASVSISALPGLTICSGTNVTFTASPVNGGTPTYQWKKNGTNVGTNSNQYSNNALINSDQITCQMSSSAGCVTGSPATSNLLTLTVTSPPVINNFSPSSGSSGSSVTINGSNFINVNTVSFNGVNSTFIVNSSAQITATVPGGASTGLISIAASCGTTNSSTSFIIGIPGVALYLKLFVEGYYVAGCPTCEYLVSQMRPCLWNNVQAGSLPVPPFPQGPYTITDCDYIDISAMDASTDNLIQTQTGLLHTDGTVNVTFSSPVASSTSYYIRIRHRNAMETWSALPVDFSATTSIAPYDFTAAVTRAFSYDYSVLPMHQMTDGKWALLSGDMGSLSGAGIQDGNIDLFDFNFWDSDNAIFNFGYLVGDLNGDVNVDLFDFNFWDFNNAFFAFTQHP